MSSAKFVIRPEDFLVNDLFKDSSCFLELAKEHEGDDPVAARRYVRASMLAAFTALEALVNTLLVDLENAEVPEPEEGAFNHENRVKLAKGGNIERRGQRFRPLDQRIRMLHRRRGGEPVPKGSPIQKALYDATEPRNKLVHPRPSQVPYSWLTAARAKLCLVACVQLAEALGGRALISLDDWEKLSGLKLNDASGAK
jgi:hypothetical protein